MRTREYSPKQIELINITNLTTVRRTFRIGWRIFISVTFLLWVYLWWMAINKVPNVTHVLTDDRLRATNIDRGSVAASCLNRRLLTPERFCPSYLRSDGYLCVPFNTSLFACSFYLIATTPRFDRGDRIIVFAFVLLYVVLGWKYVIHRSYALLLSLIPVTRLKAYRRQVVSSLLLWSGRWKSVEATRIYEDDEKALCNPWGPPSSGSGSPVLLPRGSLYSAGPFQYCK